MQTLERESISHLQDHKRLIFLAEPESHSSQNGLNAIDQCSLRHSTSNPFKSFYNSWSSWLYHFIKWLGSGLLRVCRGHYSFIKRWMRGMSQRTVTRHRGVTLKLHPQSRGWLKRTTYFRAQLEKFILRSYVTALCHEYFPRTFSLGSVCLHH